MTADDASPQEPDRRIGAIRRSARRLLARWRPILLTLVLVATTGYAVGYFYLVYRPDMQTDNAAAHQVIKAASDGAVALLSYSPETLDRDLTNAKSRVTEDYLAYYQRFADQIVGPAAQRGQVTTTASVVKAAVSEMHPNSAVVLVFLKQKTASKEKPQPIVTSSSVRVEMTKVNGSWLIEKLEAIEPQPKR
ncbi:twin-arginine translocation pathway signal [Mycobacterium paraense]|uniref:Twin-arginine translocation pathway signal n=1 Tax=Mycobacterium paraense TaxID=767916 RepID=A0ABX3VFK9_9MYCO|nr:twin-arginine translocation pathway signal [Mycobacterium paraense]ORW26976.1 twin-arginine translocation pathway signal [Mycobacterium paraense]ORW45301.1 twin-arginine translocation pathway signal [Mycobacterium paraense]ORW49389.1 twin-arginine translocation pathway signal [Mycobacterium paraense]